MKKNIFTIVFLFATSNILLAQKIENTASFRDIKSDSYFRFNYDNDYFGSTDENYTQGYNFELVAPFLEKNPVNKLFLKPKNSEFKYGLSIEHIGFTPFSIGSPEIQLGDRPFAAAIMLKSFSIATDTIQKSRLVSTLSIGLIGPGAFGKEMQVGIHEATGNTIPMGWQNQIKNDVVLNYELIYEKQLVRYNNLFALNANTKMQLGTLFTNASVGFNTSFGIINSAFTSVKNKNKFQLYLFLQPSINIIGYDATLQGGLFNDKSPYTISSNSIERFTAQSNYGLILQTKTLYFEYFIAHLTREFKTGSSAKYGGIKIGFKF
ncbi:lipid A deacylase LpxR family protein [Flavobacterium sp.]|jgi:lipid A 3-O-deacylase|uniref:lipid A deacylase LpxR family protein n=1 Tax=Flavobacterium sp. TaxID=239 RepID=UPI0037BF6C96